MGIGDLSGWNGIDNPNAPIEITTPNGLTETEARNHETKNGDDRGKPCNCMR